MIREHWHDTVWQDVFVPWPGGELIRVSISMTFGEAITRFAQAAPYELAEVRWASDRMAFMGCR